MFAHIHTCMLAKDWLKSQRIGCVVRGLSESGLFSGLVEKTKRCL